MRIERSNYMGCKKILMLNAEKHQLGQRFFPLGFYIASSILSKNGFEVKCLDLSFFRNPQKIIQDTLDVFCPEIIGFSVCSANNYKMALELVYSLKLYLNFYIIFGGQHMHPPTNGKTPLYDSCIGDMEMNSFFFDRNIKSERLESPDYSLVDNINLYYPAVEVSRGCWNLCNFCNSNNAYVEKPLNKIENELNYLSFIYPRDSILTLAGSNHAFLSWKRSGLLNVLKEYSSHFRFNFNLGVESNWESIWDDIINLNIWNIFVGIDAICEETLINMGKTRTPHRYIEKSNNLLYRCKTDGIYTFATYIYMVILEIILMY